MSYLNNLHILLVDDEQSITQMIAMVLQKEGFTNVHQVATGAATMEYIKNNRVDFIILDVMLPDANGFELCSDIRELTDAYILFLTAKVKDFDVLTGFERGGDDYVTKPFNPLEIVARIKAFIRRQQPITNVAAPIHKKLFDFGHFVVDEDRGELIVAGKIISCPAQVFLLLLYFCKNPNRILSKEQLFTAVWGYQNDSDDNTVMVHIHRIRERIEPNPSEPSYLVTVRGLGYKLVKENKQ